GKKIWMLDARSHGRGPRFFGATKEEVLRKHQDFIGGVNQVVFDRDDCLAKVEMRGRGTLLEAVRFYLTAKQKNASRNCRPARAKSNQRLSTPVATGDAEKE